MKRIAAVVVLALSLFVIPVQANAVPVTSPQIVGYEHAGHNPNSEIYRSAFSSDCRGGDVRFYPSAYVALRLSGVLLWVPSGNTYCNFLYVTDGTFDTWGACVNHTHTGYDFGPGWNDNTWIIGLRHSSACINWTSTPA